MFKLECGKKDGIKIKGDKIGMPCTHSTRHVIPSPRESTTQAVYCHTKQPRNCTITTKAVVKMRRDNHTGGIHKQVSAMLNIKFTLSCGGGLAQHSAHDRSRRIHSQYTATSATACLACYRYSKRSTRIEKLSLHHTI